MSCNKKQKTIKEHSWWQKFFGYEKKKSKVKDNLEEHLVKMVNSGKFLVHISYKNESGCITSFNCAYDYEFSNIKTSVMNFNEYFANTNTMKDNSDDASNKKIN
jgi:hypothetical protein